MYIYTDRAKRSAQQAHPRRGADAAQARRDSKVPMGSRCTGEYFESLKRDPAASAAPAADAADAAGSPTAKTKKAAGKKASKKKAKS